MEPCNAFGPFRRTMGNTVVCAVADVMVALSQEESRTRAQATQSANEEDRNAGGVWVVLYL